MFRKILYPTDFSAVAGKALEYVKKLKEAGTKEVVILHVIESNELEAMVETCMWKNEDVGKCEKEIERRMKQKAREKMKKIKEELEKEGIKTKVSVRIGKPFVEIINVAKKEKISLIVMGSHGRSMVEEMLLGSVAESVIHHASVPVMIIKGVKK